MKHVRMFHCAMALSLGAPRGPTRHNTFSIEMLVSVRTQHTFQRGHDQKPKGNNDQQRVSIQVEVQSKNGSFLLCVNKSWAAAATIRQASINGRLFSVRSIFSVPQR